MHDESKKLDWKDYYNNRLIAEHPSGFSIIIPKGCPESTPVFCPLCGCANSTSDDITSCDEVGCCQHCKQEHYYQNKLAWEKGWRPDAINDCKYVKTVIVK
jgi:hypothetical protein